jgi:ribosomal protein S18 acetylase RimI-like enzyme
MTVTVRPIRREDAESIVGMQTEFGAYLVSLGDHWDPKFTEARYLEDGFGPDPAFNGFIAEEADKPQGDVPLGYLLYTPTYDSDTAQRGIFVIDLWVRPWTRRLGVGRKLMTATADLARQRGGDFLLWSVYRPNTLARQFYDKLGGKETADLDWMTLKV